MEEATNEWATEKQKSCMAEFSFDVSVQTRIMKTLAYPMDAITFTKQECNKLMSKIKMQHYQKWE